MLNMAAQAAYADPRDSAPEATAPEHSELSGPAVDDEGLQLVPGTPLRATATALPIDSLAAALCPELDPPQLTMPAMPAEDVVCSSSLASCVANVGDVSQYCFTCMLFCGSLPS
jgi:hypothetical protein